ncbi:MAG: ABC transporter permease [Verrucomicrobiae bacterium]|nr:ABC transporter permease [Verrucomicrobiae bacterium]
MLLFLSINVGLKEIFAHKIRSFLMMTGIILGVVSLVVTFAIVDGSIRATEERLIMHGGVERVSVIKQDVPTGKEELKDLSPGITIEDAKIIQTECPHVVAVSPEVSLGMPSVQYLNKTVRAGVTGVTEPYLMVNYANQWKIGAGRFISDLDLETDAMVCVIGESVWAELEQPDDESPLDNTIKINDQPFKIIGVIPIPESETERKRRESGKMQTRLEREQKRRSGLASYLSRFKSKKAISRYYGENLVVLIPLTTMQSLFKSASRDLGYNQKGPDPALSALNFKVKNVSVLADTIDKARAALLKTHRGVEDFGFNTRENWYSFMKPALTVKFIKGAIMAGISMVVGGIGIANIMLASIAERIREIGIRMAVGARRRDIFWQILVESCALAVIGGILGIGASFGAIRLFEQYGQFDYALIVTLDRMAIAVGASALTGLLSGFYPALRAAHLKPLEALRFE